MSISNHKILHFAVFYFTILLNNRTEEFSMKNLLNYQSSEYDCGPVSIIDRIRYLFVREQIYPEIRKIIMLYCMDSYNET